MASFNKVILLGNLSRDPVLRRTTNGSSVVEFTVAVNRKFKVNNEEREEVAFVDCTAFGKQADVINEYCQKGKPLMIEGRLKQDSWEDKQTGQKRSKIGVIVENFQMLGGRDGGKQEKPKRDDDELPPAGSQFTESDIPF